MYIYIFIYLFLFLYLYDRFQWICVWELLLLSLNGRKMNSRTKYSAFFHVFWEFPIVKLRTKMFRTDARRIRTKISIITELRLWICRRMIFFYHQCSWNSSRIISMYINILSFFFLTRAPSRKCTMGHRTFWNLFSHVRAINTILIVFSILKSFSRFFQFYFFYDDEKLNFSLHFAISICLIFTQHFFVSVSSVRFVLTWEFNRYGKFSFWPFWFFFLLHPLFLRRSLSRFLFLTHSLSIAFFLISF